MSKPTAKEIKQFNARMAALSARLAAGGPFDAVSLSRSYGLPLRDVEREIRSAEYGK